MRRIDRQITDRAEIDAIIRRCRVCRLGTVDSDGHPYVVPLCFGYDGTSIYLHTAAEGRKLDCLQQNPNVCLEFDIPGDVIQAPNPCGWGMAYESAIASGVAKVLEPADLKRHALDCIMRQYTSGKSGWAFPEASLSRTTVVRIGIAEVTGKAGLTEG